MQRNSRINWFEQDKGRAGLKPARFLKNLPSVAYVFTAETVATLKDAEIQNVTVAVGAILAGQPCGFAGAGLFEASIVAVHI